MRYCSYCRRINPARPVFCQYCGHSFDVRICRSCRQTNPPEAMYCQNCGRGDLSEPAGPGLPFMFLIKAFLLFFGFLFILGLMKSLFSVFVILGNMLIVLIICCLGYFFLPQPLQGLVKKMLGAIKGFIFKRNE